ARVEEKPLAGEAPEEFVQRAACDKAGEVSSRNRTSWVLGADTVVVHRGKILGKPVEAEEALQILQALAGQKHIVHTGFCLMHGADDISVRRVITTEVCFSTFPSDIAAAYVSTGEPLDKAGAYGIQGIGGFLVEKIYGSYSNVVGLPLAEVVEELMRYGVVAPANE
ncbi:Maf family protein, partial [Thermodesulfobacteriota bacterium]